MVDDAIVAEQEVNLAQTSDEDLDGALVEANEFGKPPVEDIIPDAVEEPVAKAPETETEPEPTTTEPETQPEPETGESPETVTEPKAEETPPVEEPVVETEPVTEPQTEPNPELEAVRVELEKAKADRDQMSKIVRRQGTDISERNKIIEKLSGVTKPAANTDANADDGEGEGETLTRAELKDEIAKEVATAEYENLQAKEKVLEAKELLMNAIPELEKPEFREAVIEVALKDGVSPEEIEKFKADPYSADPGATYLYSQQARTVMARNEQNTQIEALRAEIEVLKKSGTDKLAKKIDAAASQSPQVSATSGGGSPAAKALNAGQLDQISDEELDSSLEQANEAKK